VPRFKREGGDPPSSGTVVGLVGCVKMKQSAPSPAKDLYVSPLFRGQRQAVEGRCDRWFILSAKHRLLDPELTIEPYEEALHGTSRRHKQSWSAAVLAELQAELGDLDGLHFEIHAGQDYYAYGLADGLVNAGATVALPTKGLTLGQKLAYYREGEHPAPHTRSGPTPSRPLPDQPQSSAKLRGARPPDGKYRPLYDHLHRLTQDRWDAAFDEVEAVTGIRLPASARNHAAWWANEVATHSHARSWVAAGFRTTAVNLTREQVTFVRVRS